MNIILLSGGSGKRLWPLSNDVRSKQFLKIFCKADGTKESMIQRMYRMITNIDKDAQITIATSENQIPQIEAQLGNRVNISPEPMRRNTFPAIALAVAYLKKQGVGKEESVVVCPVDPYVEDDYFECLKRLDDEASKKTAANLTLMGIEPTYPSEKYGYIIPKSIDIVTSVKEFKEKPNEKTAKQYIADGALWNGGVFAFRLSYLLNIIEKMYDTSDYHTLYEKYHTLSNISFDYAIVEKESSINVIRFHGLWKDLGTWNTFTEAMYEKITGNVVIDGCENTHVINELMIPFIVLGMKDAIIAATPDGILVSSKKKSLELKEYVSNSRPMYECRVWGEYRVLNYKVYTDGQNSLTKELVIASGRHISYQRHKHRTEIWTFTKGVGKLILDGNMKTVGRGDVVVISPGIKHAIKGITELHIIEVQIGDELVEDDVERFNWDQNWED